MQQNNNKLKNYIYKFLEIIASKKCGTIVAVSKGEYDEAIKISKNVVEIDNGVEITNLPYIREHYINRKLQICTLGRICFQKDPDIFNEIAKKFENIDFTWIGDGEMRNKLEAKNIKITGWMQKSDALNIMNENDIFILTSLWEGLPIALLEAMYLGKICIVSNVIGNRDVIINNVNGFIAKSVDDYVSIITRIINNEVNCSGISLAAHNDIVSKYNMNLVSKRYINLYTSYLSTNINNKYIKKINLQD